MTDGASVPPQVAITRMIFAGWTSQAVRAMASLELADHLAQGPRRIDELAEAADTDTSALRRLIVLLVGLGLVEWVDGSEAVALTPVGSLLRSDTPGSAKDFALMITAPWITRAFEALPDAIRTGKSVFDDVHGMGFWEYLTANPEYEAVFDAAMTGRAEQRAAAILEACDLRAARMVIDIGGGQGRLLAALLAEDPHLRGILVDRAEAVAGAGPVLAAAGVTDRCETVAADFFTAVPSGGDAYVLAQILHDWPDDDALRILRVCAAAMAPGARLFIVEQVLSSGDGPDVARALADLNMLVLVGGKERNADEYAALLHEAGFADMAILPTRTMWTVVEATKR